MGVCEVINDAGINIRTNLAVDNYAGTTILLLISQTLADAFIVMHGHMYEHKHILRRYRLRDTHDYVIDSHFSY